MTDFAGIPRAGYQPSGSYVLSAEEQRFDCRRLRERSDGLLDQLKALAGRAGVQNASWLRFRHTLSTLGKGRFGMSREQVQAQLRHTTQETQKHYDHDDLRSLREAVRGIDFSG